MIFHKYFTPPMQLFYKVFRENKNMASVQLNENMEPYFVIGTDFQETLHRAIELYENAKIEHGDDELQRLTKFYNVTVIRN